MNELSWLQKHERILLGTLLLAVVLWLGNKFLNHSVDVDTAKAQAAQQVLDAQKKANDQIALQNQQAQQQYQILLGQMNAQNQKLTAEMPTLSQTLAARQKSDASLSLPDLGLRWESLLGISTGVQSTENGLLVSPRASVQTVQNLEQLPVIKQQLSDETAIAENRGHAVDNAQNLVLDLNKQISGLNLQLSDSSKACDANIALEKAKARKSKLKFFKAGVVVGFIGGLISGHYIP